MRTYTYATTKIQEQIFRQPYTRALLASIFSVWI